MGIFDLFKESDINTEIANLEDSTVLLDVREADEFRAGHIPGAVNVPLSTLSQAHVPWDRDTAIYVYCLAGTRSKRAVSFLQSKGYTNVKNIGGMKSYKGSVEK